jgi:hypothetical protein
MVVHLVTSGGIQQNQALVSGLGSGKACAKGDVACRVLGAAYEAFYAGLHLALVISGCLLLAAVPVSWLLLRDTGQPTAGRVSRRSVVATPGTRQPG